MKPAPETIRIGNLQSSPRGGTPDPLMQQQNDLLQESNKIAKETLAVMKENKPTQYVPLNTTPPGKPAAAEADSRNRGQRFGVAP